MSRARGRVETREFAAFTRRILRAYVKRAEQLEMDPADLADLAQLQRDLDTVLKASVSAVHRSGFSWAEIAAALGTTRQSAHERFSSGSP